MEMYRFPAFGLAEFTIEKQKSTSEATLGFYACIYVDLGYFNTFAKALELVGIPSGGGERRGWGKINPETSCSL